MAVAEGYFKHGGALTPALLLDCERTVFVHREKNASSFSSSAKVFVLRSKELC
jgi:hypothetical protein